MYEPDTGPLEREDFQSQEEYLHYLHINCLEPPDWEPVHGDGHYASFYRAVHGATRRQNQCAWEGYGRTTHIRGTQFGSMYNAIAFANSTGRVMNVHMTIAFATVGITSDVRVAKSLKHFLELFRKFCRGLGLPTLWVYALERSDTRGLHCHVIAHMPRDYAASFEKWALHALSTVSGRAPVRKASSRTVVIRHRKDRDISSQWHWFRYVMKGVHPGLAFNGKDRRAFKPVKEIAALRTVPQGAVMTKRVGVSRALDKAAREAAGFRSPFELGADTPAELFYDWQRIDMLQSLSKLYIG